MNNRPLHPPTSPQIEKVWIDNTHVYIQTSAGEIFKESFGQCKNIAAKTFAFTSL